MWVSQICESKQNPNEMVHDHSGFVLSRQKIEKRNEENCLGEVVHHDEDNSIATGWRETGDKIQGNMQCLKLTHQAPNAIASVNVF